MKSRDSGGAMVRASARFGERCPWYSRHRNKLHCARIPNVLADGSNYPKQLSHLFRSRPPYLASTQIYLFTHSSRIKVSRYQHVLDQQQ